MALIRKTVENSLHDALAGKRETSIISAPFDCVSSCFRDSALAAGSVFDEREFLCKTRRSSITSFDRSTLRLIRAFVMLAHGAISANRYSAVSSANSLTPGTATWNTGVTIAWSTAATPGATAPGMWANCDDAFFQTAGTNTATIGGAVQAISLTQTTSGTATTISGGTLQPGKGTAATITNSGNSALSIASAIALSGNATVSTTSPVLLGGSIGGAFTLAKTGANSLTLSGTNTFSGTTTVSAGSLLLGGTTNGGLGSGQLDLGNGRTVGPSDATARKATNTMRIGNANVGDNGFLPSRAAATLRLAR